MSGGHFEYRQDRLVDFAQEIDDIIAHNSEDCGPFGDPDWEPYRDHTIAKFKQTSHTLRRAAAMIQRIDWLICHDDNEETFHERWGNEVRPDCDADSFLTNDELRHIVSVLSYLSDTTSRDVLTKVEKCLYSRVTPSGPSGG